MKAFLRLFCMQIVLQGCAFSVHQVHLSGFDPYRPKSEAKIVTASGERFSVLGFATSTDYIDQAVAQLSTRCQNGELVGVSTEIQTALGFFSWTDRVFLRGSCLAELDGLGGEKTEVEKQKIKLKARKKKSS